MTVPESIELCNLIGKLWGTKINDAQLLALQPRLKDLPIDLANAKLAVNEEFLNPSADKVPVLARIWRRLQGIAKPQRAGVAAPVALTPAAVADAIAAAVAQTYERGGEVAVVALCDQFWREWRKDLMTAGMGWADAGAWLVENTATERAWVDERDRLVDEYLRRMRARRGGMVTPALPVARKAPGFYTLGEPQIGAA